jgi:hypothetical protein
MEINFIENLLDLILHKILLQSKRILQKFMQSKVGDQNVCTYENSYTTTEMHEYLQKCIFSVGILEQSKMGARNRVIPARQATWAMGWLNRFLGRETIPGLLKSLKILSLT